MLGTEKIEKWLPPEVRVESSLFKDVWLIYFQNKQPDKATCQDCLDSKLSLCKGGRPPVECMAKLVLEYRQIK